MAKKKKTVPSSHGTKVLGIVAREYVAHNVPDTYIQDVAEAISKVILSDVYAHILRLERVTETE